MAAVIFLVKWDQIMNPWEVSRTGVICLPEYFYLFCDCICDGKNDKMMKYQPMYETTQDNEKPVVIRRPDAALRCDYT